MKKKQITVKTTWDIRGCFERLRNDKQYNLGNGGIRLTIEMQEEICKLVDRYYGCTNYK